MKPGHLISIADMGKSEILTLIKSALEIKSHPKKYQRSLFEKTLFTFFELPSLRTELSFDVAMFQLGGEIIDYHAESSPWASGKESIEDVAKVVSRYCDAAMLRMKKHEDVVNFAKNSKIPVINGLTDYEHPVQILSDLLTMQEKKKNLDNLRIAYIGDSNNNVTTSLMYATALLGMHMHIGCPHNPEFMPSTKVFRTAFKLAKKGKGVLQLFHSANDAARDVDVVYTDSWMSYRIPRSELHYRQKILKPYQISSEVMEHAQKNAIFMHCLPALRGQEVTADVIDSKSSVVFDQAENRLHMQKAILLRLI